MPRAGAVTALEVPLLVVDMDYGNGGKDGDGSSGGGDWQGDTWSCDWSGSANAGTGIGEDRLPASSVQEEEGVQYQEKCMVSHKNLLPSSPLIVL